MTISKMKTSMTQKKLTTMTIDREQFMNQVLQNLISQNLPQEEVDTYLEQAITGTAYSVSVGEITLTQEEIKQISEAYLEGR